MTLDKDVTHDDMWQWRHPSYDTWQRCDIWFHLSEIWHMTCDDTWQICDMWWHLIDMWHDRDMTHNDTRQICNMWRSMTLDRDMTHDDTDLSGWRVGGRVTLRVDTVLWRCWWHSTHTSCGDILSWHMTQEDDTKLASNTSDMEWHIIDTGDTNVCKWHKRQRRANKLTDKISYHSNVDKISVYIWVH